MEESSASRRIYPIENNENRREVKSEEIIGWNFLQLKKRINPQIEMVHQLQSRINTQQKIKGNVQK